MDALNNDLFEWQKRMCKNHTIVLGGQCHDRRHHEVTYGEYESCEGCPYNAILRVPIK